MFALGLLLRGAVVVGFVGYGVVYFVVAVQSDPTWWWFVPVLGDYLIFRESVWWGLFAVAGYIAVMPAALVWGFSEWLLDWSGR